MSVLSIGGTRWRTWDRVSSYGTTFHRASEGMSDINPSALNNPSSWCHYMTMEIEFTALILEWRSNSMIIFSSRPFICYKFYILFLCKVFIFMFCSRQITCSGDCIICSVFWHLLNGDIRSMSLFIQSTGLHKSRLFASTIFISNLVHSF